MSVVLGLRRWSRGVSSRTRRGCELACERRRVQASERRLLAGITDLASAARFLRHQGGQTVSEISAGYDPWKSSTGDILRPPLATERLLRAPDGLARIAFRKPFSDGTVAVDLDLLSLL